jgi:nitroimidazol reductase NimA-like FMN-containing flavoprotein (pyridoxamine 5'-phosphate oxidase superfamily)
VLTKLTNKELAFLRRHEVGRLATASKAALPHIVPVVFAMDGDRVVIAVDYRTKKLKNLMENPVAAIVVDDYDPNMGIMIQGKCEILERGKEYLRLLKVLFDRFEFYRKNPWGEGESPIIVVIPDRKASWGIR